MVTIAKLCERSSSSSNNSVWDCPVCFDIPRKEIYLCSKGHSICDSCIKKVRTCPVCRATFFGSLHNQARNYLAENILDEMEFHCPWKDFGCVEFVRRRQLSYHEENCKFSPIDVCSVGIPSQRCSYPISKFLLNSSTSVAEILNHMKTTHGYLVQTGLVFGYISTLNFGKGHFDFGDNLPQLNKCTPTFVEIVNSDQLASRSELIMLMYQFRSSCNSAIEFSWAFVWLTEKKSDPNCTITVNCSVVCNSECKTAAVLGHICGTPIVWTIAPMGMSEFRNYLKKPLKQRPKFQCTLPVSQIRTNYVNSSGVFSLSFGFKKVECQKHR